MPIGSSPLPTLSGYPSSHHNSAKKSRNLQAETQKFGLISETNSGDCSATSCLNRDFNPNSLTNENETPNSLLITNEYGSQNSFTHNIDLDFTQSLNHAFAKLLHENFSNLPVDLSLETESTKLIDAENSDSRNLACAKSDADVDPIFPMKNTRKPSSQIDFCSNETACIALSETPNGVFGTTVSSLEDKHCASSFPVNERGCVDSVADGRVYSWEDSCPSADIGPGGCVSCPSHDVSSEVASQTERDNCTSSAKECGGSMNDDDCIEKTLLQLGLLYDAVVHELIDDESPVMNDSFRPQLNVEGSYGNHFKLKVGDSFKSISSERGSFDPRSINENDLRRAMFPSSINLLRFDSMEAATGFLTTSLNEINDNNCHQDTDRIISIGVSQKLSCQETKNSDISPILGSLFLYEHNLKYGLVDTHAASFPGTPLSRRAKEADSCDKINASSPSVFSTCGITYANDHVDFKTHANKEMDLKTHANNHVDFTSPDNKHMDITSPENNHVDFTTHANNHVDFTAPKNNPVEFTSPAISQVGVTPPSIFITSDTGTKVVYVADDTGPIEGDKDLSETDKDFNESNRDLIGVDRQLSERDKDLSKGDTDLTRVAPCHNDAGDKGCSYNSATAQIHNKADVVSSATADNQDQRRGNIEEVATSAGDNFKVRHSQVLLSIP